MATTLSLKMSRYVEVNLFLVWISCALIRGAEMEPTVGDPGGAEPMQCSGWCFCDPHSAIISCAGDGSTSLPASDLTLSAVERVEIRNFALGRWHSKQLHNATQLRELGVVRCQLNDVAANSFSDNARLERLDLSQNLLTTITESMFTGLIRLKSLDLSSNKLTRIEEAFLRLSALEQLNLRDNALTVLGPNSFKGLYRLQFLNVDSNNVSVIGESALQELTGVAHLILSHNPLSGLIHLDLFAARITYLDLSSAQLDKIPSLMARYVRDLRLQGNKLGVLHKGDFESLVHVRLLVLDDSGITGVEDDTFGRMDKLEKLYLNDNLLREIPQTLPPTSLRHLYLSGNRIQCLRPTDLSGLAHLEQLHLARNFIDSVELGAFADLQELTLLDLQKNNISRVTRDMFFGLKKLKFLDLSDNPIIHVDILALSHSPGLINPKLSLHQKDADLKSGNQSSRLNDPGSFEVTSTWKPSITSTESGQAAEMKTVSLVTTQRTTIWPRNQAAFRSPMTETSHFFNLAHRKSGSGDERSILPGGRKTAKMKEIAIITTPKTAISSPGAKSVPKPTNQLPPAVNWSSIILWWFAICAVVLSGLSAIVSLFCCLSKKNIYKSKCGFALWKRSTAPDARQKDSVKVGWTIDDFDQWAVTSSTEMRDSEHERLILALK